MHRNSFTALTLVLSLACIASAQDYKAATLDSAAPADKLPAEVAGALSKTGYRVVRGESRSLVEIWPVSELAIADVKTSDTVLYPLTPGQLLGVVRFPRKVTDFRSQEIGSGVYTIRYSQQPVDGAHVGTSPTRDFLVLIPAEQDTSPAVIGDYKQLTTLSKGASETSHPAIFMLVKAAAEGEAPQVRHDEERDWWILRFAATGKKGDAQTSLPVEMVVVGHAAE